jgi:hypothetical protein
MRDDVGLDGKMASTLRLLRGARLFDIKFIAEIPLAALAGIGGEVSQVAAIPICAVNLAALERELPEYKRLADEDWARPEAERSIGWNFAPSHFSRRDLTISKMQPWKTTSALQ